MLQCICGVRRHLLVTVLPCLNVGFSACCRGLQTPSSGPFSLTLTLVNLSLGICFLIFLFSSRDKTKPWKRIFFQVCVGLISFYVMWPAHQYKCRQSNPKDFHPSIIWHLFQSQQFEQGGVDISFHNHLFQGVPKASQETVFPAFPGSSPSWT